MVCDAGAPADDTGEQDGGRSAGEAEIDEEDPMANIPYELHSDDSFIDNDMDEVFGEDVQSAFAMLTNKEACVPVPPCSVNKTCGGIRIYQKYSVHVGDSSFSAEIELVSMFLNGRKVRFAICVYVY